MKTLKRTLAVVAAVAMLVSMFSVVAFAERTTPNHTITATASKTTVKPGDDITLEISLDTSKGLMLFGYGFTIPKALIEPICMPVEDPTNEETGYKEGTYNKDYFDANFVALASCIDTDWYDGYSAIQVAKKFGDLNLGIVSSDDNYIIKNAGARAGNLTGIVQAAATSNMVLGKFNLKIAETAPVGQYTIAITADSSVADKGDSVGATPADGLNCAPLTITVEAAGPTLKSIAADKTTVGIARLDYEGNEGYYNESEVDTAKVADAIAKNLNVTATYSDNSTAAVAYKTGSVADGFEITDITLNSEDYIEDGGTAKVSYAGKTINIAFTVDKFVSSEIDEKTAEQYLVAQGEYNQKVYDPNYKEAPAEDEDESPVVVSSDTNLVKGSRFDMNTISANLYTVIDGSGWADSYVTSVSRFFFTVNNYDGLGDETTAYKTGAIAFKIAEFDSFDFAVNGIAKADNAIKAGTALKGDSNIFFIDVTGEEAASTPIYAKPFIIVYKADGETIDHIIWDDQMIKNNCNTVYTYKVEE